RLERRAKKNKVTRLVRTHCMDMNDIPEVFPDIDLLWSEGAAYNIGFANALTTWARAIKPDGFAVVSELCWLSNQAPLGVRKFFQSGYPDMKSVPENIAIAETAGYTLCKTYTLPDAAWTEDYYDVLEPRAEKLIDHTDPGVKDFARETIQEIE